MPVLDKPTIQYVVEEALEAGIDDILIITGRGKQAIERHFDKSSQDEAPSNLAITGRYVFTPEIFDHLEQTELGVGDELQLTDAIRKLNAVRGVELSGNRYDIGDIPSWLHANIEMALHHDEGEMNDAVEAVVQEYKQ